MGIVLPQLYWSPEPNPGLWHMHCSSYFCVTLKLFLISYILFSFVLGCCRLKSKPLPAEICRSNCFMKVEFIPTYFLPLLPTDTPWLCSPLWVSQTPVRCTKGCLGCTQDCRARAHELSLWILLKFWPWQKGILCSSSWALVRSEHQPETSPSWQFGCSCTVWEAGRAGQGGPELLCATWPHSQGVSTGIVELTCVNIARYLWMEHWVSEMLFMLLWGWALYLMST